MAIFDRQYTKVISFLDEKRAAGEAAEYFHSEAVDWPDPGKRSLVLSKDTAVELGNPRDASTSFLLWLDDPHKVRDRRITVIGPDVTELNGKRAPFGKVVIVAGDGFDEENSYNRHREMERLRYDVHLEGYMMRGVSQYMREWSRISLKAVEDGFSFRILGGALIDKYSQLDYIRAVEVVFITSGLDDVMHMSSVAEGVVRITGAMNKMAEELSFDCDECDYNDVCGDVSEMRAMRNAMKKREAAAHA